MHTSTAVASVVPPQCYLFTLHALHAHCYAAECDAQRQGDTQAPAQRDDATCEESHDMTSTMTAGSSGGDRSSPVARVVFAALALMLCCARPVSADPIAVGKGELTIDIDGTAIDVYTYKPERYTDGAILLTLHGVGRNADGYRNHTRR